MSFDIVAYKVPKTISDSKKKFLINKQKNREMTKL